MACMPLEDRRRGRNEPSRPLSSPKGSGTDQIPDAHADYADGGVAGCRCTVVLSRPKTHTRTAIAAPHTANATFTTQPGAAPTLRSRKGRKFHVVMWT